MKNLIDTHAHIYYDDFKNDLDDVINNAYDSGVTRIICIGVDIKSSIKSLEISNKYKNIYCTIGCHPHESSKIEEGYLIELENMAKDDKVVGIGETGLDYYYNHSKKDKQKKCFIEQIELANELNLPVVIHNRNSDKDMYEILNKFRPKGVIHCFSSNIDFAKKIIDLGIIISFTGIITFKNSHLNEVIQNINLEDFMLETDSPYLTPEPFRGKRNEPKNVSYIAEKIASIKNISIDETIYHTTQNALNLFDRMK